MSRIHIGLAPSGSGNTYQFLPLPYKPRAYGPQHLTTSVNTNNGTRRHHTRHATPYRDRAPETNRAETSIHADRTEDGTVPGQRETFVAVLADMILNEYYR